MHRDEIKSRRDADILSRLNLPVKAIHAAINGVSGMVRTTYDGWKVIWETIARQIVVEFYTIKNLTKALKDGAGGYTLRDAVRDSVEIAADQMRDYQVTMWEAADHFKDWADNSAKITEELFKAIAGEIEFDLSGGIAKITNDAIGAGGVTFGKDDEKTERKNPWQFRGGNWAEENSAAARSILINGSLSSGRNAAAAKADATVNTELPKAAAAAERAADTAERQAEAAEEQSQFLRDIDTFLSDWEAI